MILEVINDTVVVRPENKAEAVYLTEVQKQCESARLNHTFKQEESGDQYIRLLISPAF